MEFDRRQHCRFLAQDNIFTKFGDNPVKFGKLRDISIRGLAFEYVSHENIDEKSLVLDIFLPENKFQLSKIQCKVIYNIVLCKSDINQAGVQKLPIRRCGVKFEGFTKEKRAQLEFFLKNYTKELAVFFR